MKYVDLNADVGESFGAYTLGNDEEIMKYISSANIACGMHAGDPLVMEKTVRLAKKYGVSIGAHPGYPDLQGFGRRIMQMNPEEIKAYLIYQIGALRAFVNREGLELQHVKVHGALYNLALVNEDIAKAIVEATREIDQNLILYAPFNSQMCKQANNLKVKVGKEFFADRAYNSNGLLVDRKLKGAVLHDSKLIVGRVLQLIKFGKVQTIEGEEITMEANTICLHGDNPEAINLAKSLGIVLNNEGINIRPLKEWL